MDKKAIKKTVTIKNGKATLKLSKKKLTSSEGQAQGQGVLLGLHDGQGEQGEGDVQPALTAEPSVAAD